MKKITNTISNICSMISMLLASGVFTCVLIEVFFRTMIRVPVIWTEEGARYLFICMVFIGSVVLFEKEQNIKLKILSPKLSEKGNKILHLFIYVLIIVFSTLFLLGSLVMIKMNWRIPTVTIRWFKLGYLYLASAVSCILIIILAFIKIADRLKLRS